MRDRVLDGPGIRAADGRREERLRLGDADRIGPEFAIGEAALLAELRKGRFDAMLDVFAEEPLPLDHPFRGLPNLRLAPHAAGHTADTYHRQGLSMVQEIGRLLAGEPLRHPVTPAMLATMA